MARYQFQETTVSEETLHEICPLTMTQNVISGRWKAVILWHLSQHDSIRFGELMRKIQGISKAILSKQLKELEEDRLVHRKVYEEVPPKVEYSLTAYGETILPVIEAMQTFGKQLMKDQTIHHGE